MEATVLQAGGTRHTIHIIGREEESRAGTHQVLMTKGGVEAIAMQREGRLVSPGGGQSSWSYGGGYDEQWSSQ